MVSSFDEDEENYYQTGMVYVPNDKDLEYKEDRGPLDLTRVIDDYEKLLKDSDAKMMKKLGEIEALKKEIALQKERAQASELETSLVKGTGMNSPEMLSAKKKIQELEELLKSRDYTRQHDYKFLVEENRKFEQELNETKIDNRKLSEQIEDKNNYLKELREKGVI